MGDDKNDQLEGLLIRKGCERRERELEGVKGDRKHRWSWYVELHVCTSITLVRYHKLGPHPTQYRGSSCGAGQAIFPPIFLYRYGVIY
jgi:hypothetical protein